MFFKPQDPTFKARVESDIEAEKRKKSELNKRERQLKAQVRKPLFFCSFTIKCTGTCFVSLD